MAFIEQLTPQSRFYASSFGRFLCFPCHPHQRFGLALLLHLFGTQGLGQNYESLSFLTVKFRRMSRLLSPSTGRRRREDDVHNSPPCETPTYDGNRQ